MSDPIELPSLVIGGGVAGLVAARKLARAGAAPTVIEARHRVGGLLFGDELGGVAVDLGAESFAKRSRFVADLCRDLGLKVIDPAGRSWLWLHTDGGRCHPIPRGTLGIPCDLDDPEVAAILTPDGLARAREDLTLPAHVGTDAPDLAGLVEARLGREVLDRLVAPIAGGVHSASPTSLNAETVIPGLAERLAQTGSLTGASASLRDAAPAGPIVSSVEGGLFLLPQALAADVEAHGGEIYTRMLATSIRRDGSGWVITLDNAVSPGEPHLARRPLGQATEVRTDLLVVALDGRAAQALLAPVVETWDLPRGADLLSVDLAIEHPGLGVAPRGSGLLVAPPLPGETPTVACKALTHYSSKWPWVRERGDAHILRVSYGRAGIETVEPPLGETLADASTLLGLDLTLDQVRGTRTIRFPNALPPHTPDHRRRVGALLDEVAALPGLAVTGSWVAGTGLAAVLPHAAHAAEDLMKGGRR